MTHPKRFFVLLPAIALAAGCTLSMPKEIDQMIKDTNAGAKALKEERPDAFRTYTKGDRTMHYVEVTDDTPKPLILFIHGSPGRWEDFVLYMNDPELRAKAHMISVDRPGFGGSGRDKAEVSLEKQCEDIEPLLDEASPGKRVVVVGHSYGGPIAFRLAMDHPDKITDLFILAGSIDPAEEHTKWYQYVAEWPLLKKAVPPELATANREIRHLKPDLTEMLPMWKDVKQRVTFIQGLSDDLVPAENADFAEKHLVNAASKNFIRLPDTNHFTPWNHFDLVKSGLLKQLE